MFSISVAGGLAGGGEAAAGGGGGPPAGLAEHDPLWEYVVLYTRMEADPPTDLSQYGHTFTNSGGGASLNTTDFRFGSGSGDFDGTANADFWAADHAAFDMTNQPFTIELWVRPNTQASSDIAVSHYNTSPNKQWQLTFVSGNPIRFVYSKSGTDDFVNDSGTVSLTNNNWYHIAIDRDESSILRTYLDGKIVGVFDLTGETFASPASRFHISGRDFGTGNEWDGEIDEVRITVGKNRYG